MATLTEFDSQYKTLKGCYLEIHSLWSDQKETLEYEAQNISLKNTSDEIFFYHGIARNEKELVAIKIA